MPKGMRLYNEIFNCELFGNYILAFIIYLVKKYVIYKKQTENNSVCKKMKYFILQIKNNPFLLYSNASHF